MDHLKFAEKIMSMDETAWQRHSSPWSVYTRFTCLPLISFAFWSRDWIGFYAIIPIFISFFWVWINPRLFRPPEKTNNWASMGTFGERIYLKRKTIKIPEHHITPAKRLQFLSATGLPFFIWGLYELNLWALVLGNLLIIVFKAWFVDRMVWLYIDMKDTDPVYQSWLKL